MHRQEIIDHLRQFIALKTVAGANRSKEQCLQWISTAFLHAVATPSALGGENRGAPYLVAHHACPALLWFAHVDVVPARSELFSLSREGDRLLGRGVKDMKGAALPFLLAYRDVCAQGDVPPVSILLTSDEETGGTTIPDLLRTGSLRAPIAFTPDTGSSPGIVTEHKGVVWADLLAEGTGGHGALPWESGNPIPLLALAIQRLTDAFPSGTAEDWQMTVSVTELEGGQAMNQIPKRARATLDIRYPPGECADAADACRRLESYLPAGCSLRVRLEAAPLSTDPDHPFIREFISIVEHVEGAAPLRIREHGATDARHFGAAGIPAFLYGPRGGGIHGDGEWVSLQSLEEHYRLYRELFDRLGTS